MGQNSTNVAYGFGQLGSAFNDGSAIMKPPETSAGAAQTAHDASDGSETTSTGSGGLVVDGSNIFPKGITIYGRWTEIHPIAGGHFIAYIGD